MQSLFDHAGKAVDTDSYDDAVTKIEQDKYTMDPGQSSLSQQKDKKIWSKMIFEQKQVRKMHISCIIND